MILEDKPVFIKCMLGVGELYNKDLDKLMDMYFESLIDISIEGFESAMTKIVSLSGTNKYEFFPKPGQIRELAIDKNQLTAGEAWVEVREQMDRVCGAIGVIPIFSSLIIETAVQAVGGLNTIWMAGIDQEGMYRAHFLKCFEAIRQRDNSDLLLGAPSRSEAKQILDMVDSGIKERLENNG